MRNVAEEKHSAGMISMKKQRDILMSDCAPKGARTFEKREVMACVVLGAPKT